MGCYLTTTFRDLDQISRRMRQGSRHSSTSSYRQNEMMAAAVYYMANALPASAYGAYFNRLEGSVNYEIGKIGEKVAEKVLHQEMNIKVTERTAAQGVDLIGVNRGGSSVSVEVKTSLSDKPFAKHLGKAYGKHRQGSDQWLQSVGVKDPSNTNVLGVLINPDKRTVSIFRRMDSDAKNWKCLLRNAPLSDYEF